MTQPIKEILRTSNWDDTKFINLVKSKKQLYDKSDTSAVPGGTRSLWEAISKEMGGTVGADICKRRWYYLRDYYVRQERLRKTHGKKSFWPFYDMMSFILPTVEHHKKIPASYYEKNEHGYNSPTITKFKEESHDISDIDESSSSDSDDIDDGDNDYDNFNYIPVKKIMLQDYSAAIPIKSHQEQSKRSQKIKTNQERSLMDEHEHFFESLLPNVRKVDPNNILPMRIEMQKLVLKYLKNDI